MSASRTPHAVGLVLAAIVLAGGALLAANAGRLMLAGYVLGAVASWLAREVTA